MQSIISLKGWTYAPPSDGSKDLRGKFSYLLKVMFESFQPMEHLIQEEEKDKEEPSNEERLEMSATSAKVMNVPEDEENQQEQVTTSGTSHEQLEEKDENVSEEIDSKQINEKDN